MICPVSTAWVALGLIKLGVVPEPLLLASLGLLFTLAGHVLRRLGQRNRMNGGDSTEAEFTREPLATRPSARVSENDPAPVFEFDLQDDSLRTGVQLWQQFNSGSGPRESSNEINAPLI